MELNELSFFEIILVFNSMFIEPSLKYRDTNTNKLELYSNDFLTGKTPLTLKFACPEGQL